MQSTFPEPLLLHLTAKQRKIVAAAFANPDSGAAKRTEIAESILGSAKGRVWREDAARWISDLLQVQLLVPDVYQDWRLLVEESLHFLISHLSTARLASKLVDQIELPEGTPIPFRLLALFTRMPALQKLGQVLARNRYLDPALRAALSQLENSISDVDFETVQRRVSEQLSAECQQFAVEMEPAILSEASVSAVVRFTWAGESGARQHGVFKVLKPHIPACFAEDMDLFEKLSEFVASRPGGYGMALDFLPETFREIRLLLEHEIDFAGEQKSLAAAAAFYRPVAGVRIPQVVKPLCTDSITAMTEEFGLKITEAATPADRRAAQLVEALVAHPLFATEPVAMFHADPHAGNILYNDSTQELILLDWALVEFLTREQRRHTLMLTIMLGMRDEAGVLREIEALSQDPSASAPEVRTLVSEFINSQAVLTLPRSLEAMRLLDTLGKRGVRFSAPLLMFRKALFTLDGVLRDIAGPDANVDQFVFGSILRQWPAIWTYLLAPEDWFAIQWSTLSYGSRVWANKLFEPGFLQATTVIAPD
jgi:ubiquinone biosynthesis protein